MSSTSHSSRAGRAATGPKTTRTSPRRRARRPKQPELPLGRRRKWGGKRKGAGRKPTGERAGVSHKTRPALASRHAVHVTMRVRREVWNLRTHRAFDRRIAPAIAKGRKTEAGFRLVHYSVQGNHLHLVCESPNAAILARGLQGLAIRIAKALNRMMERRGPVFADRYHARILRTPREARNVLAYVFGNFAKHALEWAARAGALPAEGGRKRPGLVDPYSSARHFCGFTGPVEHPRWGPRDPPSGADPHTWLLKEGWRKAGVIRLR